MGLFVQRVLFVCSEHTFYYIIINKSLDFNIETEKNIWYTYHTLLLK